MVVMVVMVVVVVVVVLDTSSRSHHVFVHTTLLTYCATVGHRVRKMASIPPKKPRQRQSKPPYEVLIELLSRIPCTTITRNEEILQKQT